MNIVTNRTFFFMILISLDIYVDENLMTDKWNCKLLPETHSPLNFLQEEEMHVSFQIK